MGDGRDNGGKRGQLSGISIKDTWTKLKGDRIKGVKWDGWGGGSFEGIMDTTVLEQQ